MTGTGLQYLKNLPDGKKSEVQRNTYLIENHEVVPTGGNDVSGFSKAFGRKVAVGFVWLFNK